MSDTKFWLHYVTGLTVRIEATEQRKVFRRYFSGEACEAQVENLLCPQGRDKAASTETREKAARFSDMLTLMSTHFSDLKKETGIECLHERGQHCKTGDACFLHRQFVDRVTHIPVLEGTNVRKIYSEFSPKTGNARRPTTAPRNARPKVNFTITKRPRTTSERPQSARLWNPPFQPGVQADDITPDSEDSYVYESPPAITIEPPTDGSIFEQPKGLPTSLLQMSRLAQPGVSTNVALTRKLGPPSANLLRVGAFSTSLSFAESVASSHGSRGSNGGNCSQSSKKPSKEVGPVKSEIAFPHKTLKLLESAGPAWGPLGDFPAMNAKTASTKKVKGRINQLRVVMVPEKNTHDILPVCRTGRRSSDPSSPRRSREH